LNLNIIGESIDGMLRGRSNNSLIRSVLSVATHRVNDIELSALGDVKSHLRRSLLHSSSGNALKALGANSKLSVARGKARCEVNRRLSLAILASEGPVISIHAVVGLTYDVEVQLMFKKKGGASDNTVAGVSIFFDGTSGGRMKNEFIESLLLKR
jgi:hypothetical protein